MNKAQKITMAVVAFVEALVLFLYKEINWYLGDWFEFWEYKNSPTLLMLIVLFLGFGIWLLLSLKKVRK